MWFTEQAVDKFGRITPDGVITEFAGLSAPGSIAAGPDGNLWIASAFTPQIARVTPTLEITIFPTPATPTIIRPGNGNNLLFTEFSANKIASITIDGVVTESPEFVGSAPVGITAGVASRVWFLGVGTNRVYETVCPTLSEGAHANTNGQRFLDLALVLGCLFAPLFKKSSDESQQFCDCAHFLFDTALEHPNQVDTLWGKLFFAHKELQR